MTNLKKKEYYPFAREMILDKTPSAGGEQTFGK